MENSCMALVPFDPFIHSFHTIYSRTIQIELATIGRDIFLNLKSFYSHRTNVKELLFIKLIDRKNATR